MVIGQLETMGLPWRLKDEFVERINAVTAKQVQAVARKYLVESGLTVAVLDPLPMDNDKTAHNAAGGGAGDQ
jgi:zinc protease